MAWNIKYYGEWKDFDGNSNRLEILTEKTVTAKEINVNSFVIDYPGIDLFGEQAVYGCGAKIGIMSESKLFYLGELYTIEPKGLQVRHYLNSSLNYIGYLDTEQYTDDFSQRINYNIELTSNNGFAVLDRIKMADEYNQVLTGVHRAVDVIKMALIKLSIDFNNIYIGLSTSLEGGLPSNETILHKLFVKSGNYIDEKGNVMSSREVINEILVPLSARMYIQGNDIFIVDINELANESLTLKSFSFESLLYGETIVINNSNDIDTRLGGYSLSMQPGVSKVAVKFNKYVYELPRDFEFNFDNKVSEITRTNEDEINFIEKEYTAQEGIVLSDSKLISLTDTSQADKIDYFIRSSGSTIPSYDPSIPFDVPVSFTVHTGIYPVSSKNHIKLGFKMMIEDLDNINKEYNVQALYYRINYRFRLGDKIFFNNSVANKSWETQTLVDEQGTPYSATSITHYPQYSIDINKYYDAHNYNTEGLFAKLNNDESANEQLTSIDGDDELLIEFIIPQPIQLFRGSGEYWGADKNLRIRVKDIQVTIMAEDEWGNLYGIDNTDDEYGGNIDANYINDLKIETKHGTDLEDNSRGGFIIKLSGSYTDSDFATNNRLVNLNSLIGGVHWNN
ncbi:hypothetical protein [Marinilabilia salmonicolor]|uniref:hypothetical protein n=1 Tax=Marinilabilia salmonicolor TaxID=989 RepID=UPI00046953AA|nr:hypothetical protein [Marinilabilia salmonicolor]